ncbi:uncharacterized protein K02A2.6-like [Rhipicephalus sanguineus]|uniref:uncharacterized protein K02A2.6-like n=1 Tax=Rhipicephalus sanguineus TaxID=34632 RepID=UPI0018943E3B|nr:uncharacterized protein K02A2.6-like [Rhipicephalus sanguineus]
MATELFVVKCSGPALCGRDVILGLGLMHDIQVGAVLGSTEYTSATTMKFKADFKDLFQPGTGLMRGPPVNIALKKDANPRFLKARSLPYALLNKVAAELERTCQQGILTPISHSKWATPIVPVVKPDGTLRICGDFKVSVNPACDIDQYPLPKVEDIFASLKGGYWFSKLDLREAYCHIPLSEEAKKVAVLNSHKGLFAYNGLPYGIASALAIFQRRMEALLQGIPGTRVFLDDVLISEPEDSYGKTVRSVLQVFRENGIQLREDKCVFGAREVTYLGHRIDREGLHSSERKMEAIMQPPAPQNVQELRSFLGLITYYRSFLPNMSTVLAPLYQLLQQNATWRLTALEKEAFSNAKSALKNSDLVVHFDPTEEYSNVMRPHKASVTETKPLRKCFSPSDPEDGSTCYCTRQTISCLLRTKTQKGNGHLERQFLLEILARDQGGSVAPPTEWQPNGKHLDSYGHNNPAL